MKDLIDAYIKDHELAWATSTLRSERSRLGKIHQYIALGPKKMYEYLSLKKMKPYTIKTTFIRLCAFEQWSKQGTLYKEYMKKHGRRFKCVYQKEEIHITYEQARERIETLSDPFRSMAHSLLTTGCRISEAYLVRNGRVVGKGGKVRKIYGTIKETAPKSTFARKLKSIGLKPHTLRKLCATRLAEKGATPADLCKVFGWSSIATSYNYLLPKEDSKLESFMAKD